ncbi:MAG: poly(3-hydroxybutyrate) depolymerase [Pirellulaceae bacterium]|jgi:poly(3-hydroxybutyrate) depolymerase
MVNFRFGMNSVKSLQLSTTLPLVLFGFGLILSQVVSAEGTRTKISVVSSIDKTKQPCYIILPTNYENDDAQRPLVVSLHSWSADFEQRNKELEAEADRFGWIYLFPNFRGVNKQPDACGSLKAQQDIIDAVAWAKETQRVDPSRIYLTGTSGGGHMTMLMAGRYPDVWAAASAWVGISDLAAWHAKHKDSRYGAMMRASCSGAPGDNEAVDKQYIMRSPLTYLAAAKDLPLELAAGIHDGYTGSVPISHSLNAFNMIALARNDSTISAEEILQLSQKNGRLAKPTKSDQVVDESYGRQIHLRRQTGPVRVTIFEGGHEGIAKATVAWLSQHTKLAKLEAAK